MTLSMQQIALQIAERLREIAIRQGNVPFGKYPSDAGRTGGDLRKAHVFEPDGAHDARLDVKTPYARAVHDGRPKTTIRPKRKKALRFMMNGKEAHAKSVTQPARTGNPWLARAVEEMEAEGLDFLAPQIGEEAADQLFEGLKARGLKVTRR